MIFKFVRLILGLFRRSLIPTQRSDQIKALKSLLCWRIFKINKNHEILNLPFVFSLSLLQSNFQLKLKKDRDFDMSPSLGTFERLKYLCYCNYSTDYSFVNLLITSPRADFTSPHLFPFLWYTSFGHSPLSPVQYSGISQSLRASRQIWPRERNWKQKGCV